MTQHDIPTLTAQALIRPMRSGGSRPLLLRLEDGRTAHAKFQHNPQSTRSLAHDLIGNLIGQMVGAPVPEVVLVNVSHEDMERLPYLTKYRWRPGLQFATVYFETGHPLKRGEVVGLTNLADLPTCALLEAWLYNHDVKFTHILTVPGPGGPRFVILDHGFILGGPFRPPSSLWHDRHEFPIAQPFSVMALNAPVRFDFASALRRMENLTEADLRGVLEAIPRPWGVRSKDQAAIIEFLCYRQRKLARLARHLQEIWNANKPSAPMVEVSPETPTNKSDMPKLVVTQAQDWVALTEDPWSSSQPRVTDESNHEEGNDLESSNNGAD
ncbi:MAG: hypothetical protein C7B45_05280 [Sulfobacillus acidophilus]|uniref:Uncharacterized protein n=1 Tax=Sulfobacillus acidophilus TaxID=53633 RepID=A0A2T2WKV4_9FIRM|nr:MAG: hypothetical protein C7B45_05280 [Sulfobacillus acidophilus]